MKNIIYRAYKNRYFLLFILLFAYVQSIHTRTSVRRGINAYTFTPEAALATLIGTGILFLIILFFIKKWQKPNTFDTKVILKVFISSLITYVVIMKVIGFLIALSLNKIDQNFNQNTLTLSLFSDFLDGIIYGSFFLTYYYFNKDKEHQQKLKLYNDALAESKIKQLKTQLNPHFLFNNLNVLDQLIEEDKHKASDFLNEFAEIYRYVLQGTDNELVSIKQEIEFSKQYFKLIQYKYGNAYQLSINDKHTAGFIVPLSLQLLIENAIQHNIGTLANPIFIQVDINSVISVSNNINLKQNTKSKSERALKNLKEQYQLLSDKSIHIKQSEKEFSVTIPIIYKNNK